MRVCNTCFKEKPLEDFPKAKGYKDGYKPRCKACQWEYQKQWKQTEKGKESVKRSTKQWKESGGSNKALKKYRQTERWKEQKYKQKLKRRSFKCKVEFKPHERMSLLDRDNWTCQCCGVKVHDEKRNDELKANIDHIIPISKGGTSEPDNLQVLCRTCNLSKSNKMVI